MKKKISFLFLPLFLFILLTVSVAAATPIGSAEELAALMQNTNGWDKDYVLTADIDLSNVEQSPIGSYDKPFSGTFDGSGHTVTLVLRADFTAGLFGVLESATVKNLTVAGKVTNDFFAETAETKDELGQYPGTGGLAAVVLGGVTIENCKSSVSVTGPGNIGGLVGNIHAFTEAPVSVIACESDGAINSLIGNAGGLIGRIFTTATGGDVTVRNCVNRTDVTLPSEDRCRVGGIIGYIRTLKATVLVEDCENTGDITGTNSGAKASNYPYAGGIVGRNEVAEGATAAIRITDCINTGAISSTQCAGGITAYMSRADVCTENESGVFTSLNAGGVDGFLCAAGILGYSESKSVSPARSIVKNCLNIAPISSVSNAGGIIARWYGFDIAGCANLSTAISPTVSGGIAGKGFGETACEMKDSYYLDTAAAAVSEGAPACSDRGNTAIAWSDIANKDVFSALEFSPFAFAMDANGLTLHTFAGETPAVVTAAPPAETTAPEETEAPETTAPPVTTAVIETTAAPIETTVADLPSETNAGNPTLRILLICIAVIAAIALVLLLLKKRSLPLLIACTLILISAIALLIVGSASNWFTASEDVSATTTAPLQTTANPSSDQPNLPAPGSVDIAGDFTFLVAGNWAWNDYEAEENSENVVDIAIHRRNAGIAEKYGVNILSEDIVKYATSMGTGDGYRKLYTDYMAGDSNYDAAMVGTYDVATLAYNGYIQDLNDIEHLDLTKPYWDQKANKDLSMQGKMYYTTGDISLADNRATYTLFFSKEMINTYGMQDPYELVRNGDWTLETFGNMVKTIGSDDNMDGIYDKNDTFGLLTPTDTHLAILSAADERICTINEKGQLELTFYSERTVNLYDRWMEIVGDHAHTYNYQFNYMTGATGLQSSNEERISMFNTGKALFYSHTMFYMDSLRDLESDFGILPYPKLDAEQENYGNLVSAWHSQFLCVPVLNNDLARIGIVLEELAYQGKKLLTPAYYEKTLVGQYTRDEESAEMLDLIFANLVFDVGAYYNIGTYKDELGAMPRSGRSLTTIYETFRPVAETKIKQINDFFAQTLMY